MNAFEKVTSSQSLHRAWIERRSDLRKSCFGIDRVTASDFERKLPRQLRDIQNRVAAGFQPDGLLALLKPKPNGGFRVICVPTFADRLVQFSMLEQLRPRLASMGLDNAVSFGLARGVDRSVVGARKFACATRTERPWVYKTDIQKFFDNIDRSLLQAAMKRVRQPTLQPLLDAFLRTEIDGGLDAGWKVAVEKNGIVVGRGVRQGMPLSPLYAGAYLKDLDRYIIKTRVPTARYVDDIVAFFHTEKEAFAFHKSLKAQLADLGLTIGDPGEPKSKTIIYSPEAPAEFLGMELVRSPSGKYRLSIGTKVLDKIVQRIMDAQTPAALLERRVSLTNMGTYFRSLQAGFLQAYGAAENKDDLEKVMAAAVKKAQRRVLINVFGQTQLDALGPTERRFIGVDLAV
jgi:RNA-directed DNA polymerase